MNIGFFTYPADHRQKTGIAYYILSLLQEMLPIACDDKFHLIHYQKSRNIIYSKTKEVLIPNFPLPYMRQLCQDFFLLPSLLRELNLNILHSPQPFCTLFSFLAKTSFKKVMTIHDVTPLLFPHFYPKSIYLRWRFMFNLISDHIDCIIAVSNNTRDDIINTLKFPEEKIVVIHDAYNPIYFQVDKRKSFESVSLQYGISSPYLLFVGRLDPRKNIANLLKAFYFLLKRGVTHHLVLAGEKGWEFVKLAKLIEQLNIYDYVHILRYVDEEKLHLLYNASELFVYPSLYEGFGMPILEAMSCGTPVVCSNTSSFPEVAGDAAVLVNPLDPEEICHAMYKVLFDEYLREELVKRGFEQVKKFTWRKAAEETLAVYKKLVN